MPELSDERFMSLAIRQAIRGQGLTSPNPMVGAVLVKNGVVIGKGYHRRAGLPHAEIEAFLDAERRGRNPEGSTLYVTLEPCCHYDKKTPPCVGAIVEKKIKRVVVGSLDPNPRVSGRGIQMLKDAGLSVSHGVLEERCRKINEEFFKFITTRIPYVTLKLAATLDGKIAAHSGDSKWIGSELQRKLAHRLRNRADVVIVGVGTVIADNPRLNVRLTSSSGKDPCPVVLDSKLRIPLDAVLFSVHPSPIIATTKSADPYKIDELTRRGVRVLTVDMDEKGRVSWGDLLHLLGKMDFMSALVEGGAEVAASALTARAVDKIVWFFSPKIIGGDGVSMVGAMGIDSVQGAIRVGRVKYRALGEEIMVEGYPIYGD